MAVAAACAQVTGGPTDRRRTEPARAAPAGTASHSTWPQPLAAAR